MSMKMSEIREAAQAAATDMLVHHARRLDEQLFRKMAGVPAPSPIVMDDIQTEPRTDDEVISLREWYERTVPAHLRSLDEGSDI